LHFSRVLLSFVIALACTPAIGGVGNTDNRYYVSDSDWAKPPYNSFVRVREFIGSEGYTCTGQYIAKNLILSAGHCTEGGPTEFRAINYKKQEFKIKLLETKYKDMHEVGDWAIFLIEDPQYYGDAFFDPTKPERTTKVINAGYGYVRILKEEELNTIREILGDATLAESDKTFDNMLKDFEDALSKKGLSLWLITQDTDRLKASECNIVFEDCSRNPTAACNGQYLSRAGKYPDILATTCDNWQGNSGGGYVTGNKLYGVCSYGVDSVIDSRNTDYMASASQFISAVNKWKQKYPATGGQSNTSSAGETAGQGTELLSAITGSVGQSQHGPTQGDIDELTQVLQEQETNILASLQHAGKSNANALSFVGRLAEHQVTSNRLNALIENYKSAKEKEQSLANRTLTAASTAATGLGLMTAASAYSEKQADEAAEQDMTAYLATFRCEYGKGQSSKAGNEEITLPGGNELLGYYSEYKSLADNLKNTKKALGMRPGIEQEVVYDKAESGLYKYASTGITDGAFTSLSRALTDPEGKDAAEWNAQKEKTAKNLKTGLIAAGAGVVGGIAGDMLINGKKSGGDGTGLGDILDGVRNTDGIGGGLGTALGGAMGTLTNPEGEETETDEEITETNEEVTEPEAGEEVVNAENGRPGRNPGGQVSAVIAYPWTWFFASMESTEFDAPIRTVKSKSKVTGEETTSEKTVEDTVNGDVTQVVKFLKEDTTNAKMQCITVNSNPAGFAEILAKRYEQDLPELVPDIKYEIRVNQSPRYKCDRSAESCQDIVTTIHNRPCGDGD